MKIFALILIYLHPVNGPQLAVVPVESCPQVLTLPQDMRWTCIEMFIQPEGEPV